MSLRSARKSLFSGRIREIRPHQIAVEDCKSGQRHHNLNDRNGVCCKRSATLRPTNRARCAQLLPILALPVQPTPLFAISLITDNKSIGYFRNC